MIEIIYKEETQAEEVNIKLPRNIKQVGSGGGTRKVYIEDYAAGYIKMQPEAEEKYRYGVLLGEIKRSGTQSYVFVKGAVEAAEHEQVRFDDEIWTGIYEEIKQYFTENEIVGWFLNVPLVERDGRIKLQKTHLDNFAGNDKICFFFDRLEKEEAIYSYDSGMMQKRHGYYIFYEKNLEMQVYMVDKKQQEKEPVKAVRLDGGSIGGKTRQEGQVPRMGKLPSFLYSASSFLVIGVLIATIAIMNNYGQMQKISDSIDQIANNITVGQHTTEQEPSVVNADNQPTAEINILPGEVDTIEPEAESQQGQAADEPQTEVANAAAQAETTTGDNSTEYDFYKVEEGDTLSTICAKIYGTQDRKAEMMQLNGITDENKIIVGQKIKLPK